MFTIQYKSGAKIWDVPKNRLYGYVLTSTQDIEAIYEQATPVTGRVRKELAHLLEIGAAKNATPEARRFINCPP